MTDGRATANSERGRSLKTEVTCVTTCDLGAVGHLTIAVLQIYCCVCFEKFSK